MKVICFLCLTLLLFGFTQSEQGLVEIAWDRKTDKILLEFESDSDRKWQFVIVYYCLNDTIKAKTFSHIYLSEELKKRGVQSLEKFLDRSAESLDTCSSYILQYKDGYLLSSGKEKLEYCRGKGIRANIGFGNYHNADSVATELRTVFNIYRDPFENYLYRSVKKL